MSWFVELLDRDGSVRSRWPASGSTLHLGRALDNDIVLDDPHCAAHHACLHVQADGRVRLDDLGSLNGIRRARDNTRLEQLEITDERSFRLGQSLLRVRSSEWPQAPEVPLSGRAVWPWALLAMALVLGYCAWETWLGDTESTAPPYLYTLSGVALLVGIWSGIYALLGRLISGQDRFFAHLLIASMGLLFLSALEEVLTILSFASGWLWPIQIVPYVYIGLAALVVRQHLRLADSHHWPTTRWAVLLVTVGAMLVPLAQSWITHHRLTDIQILDHVAHPRWLMARPVSDEAFDRQVNQLKSRVDSERQRMPEDEEAPTDDDSED